MSLASFSSFGLLPAPVGVGLKPYEKYIKKKGKKKQLPRKLDKLKVTLDDSELSTPTAVEVSGPSTLLKNNIESDRMTQMRHQSQSRAAESAKEHESV